MSSHKGRRNEDEYFAKRDAERLKAQKAALKAELEAEERKSHYMKCPKDGYDLEAQTHQGVQVDVCGHCDGIWLDAGELEQLARQPDGGMFKRVIGDVMSALGRGKPVETPES